MKRMTALLLALALLLCSCGGQPSQQPNLPETPEEAPKKTELELLIERIQKIQQELPAHNYDISPEEQAFTQAAIDQREQLGYGRLAGRSGMGRKGG